MFTAFGFQSSMMIWISMLHQILSFFYPSTELSDLKKQGYGLKYSTALSHQKTEFSFACIRAH